MLPGYLLRLATTLGHSVVAGRAPVLGTTVVPLRIWPNDIDVYGHVNNGRYLTLMDLGRYDWFHRIGMTRVLLKERMKPVVGGASVEFRRELRPMQKVDLHTSLAGFDERALFLEQRLVRGETEHARGLLRLVLKQGRRTVPPAEALAYIDGPVTPPERPGLLDPIRPTFLHRESVR